MQQSLMTVTSFSCPKCATLTYKLCTLPMVNFNLSTSPMTTRKRIPTPSNLSNQKMNHFKIDTSNTDKNTNSFENKRCHLQRTIPYSIGTVQILYRQGGGRESHCEQRFGLWSNIYFKEGKVCNRLRARMR